jgi:hypothetical protein
MTPFMPNPHHHVNDGPSQHCPPPPLALREKASSEMRPHEEWRCVDHTSPSSRLALQSRWICAAGRVSDLVPSWGPYGTNTRRAQVRMSPITKNLRRALS